MTLFQNDEGEVLEVNQDIAISKRSTSIFGFVVQGDFSLNFRVNNNSETRAILNYKWPESLEQVAFTRQAFNLIRNGNIISRGYIVIQEDSGDFLSCFFLSGNSNWINQLKGVITDLEWVNYSTKIDVTNVRNITASSGIVFPMVDWAYNLQQGYNARFLVGGGVVLGDIMRIKDIYNDPNVSFSDFYPCLYLHTLVTELLQQNGLKLDGNILQDPLYKSMVITPVSGVMKRTPFKDLLAYGSSQAIGAFATVKYTSFTTIRDPDNTFSSSNNRFTASKNGVLIFTITCVAISNTNMLVIIYKNGVSTSSMQFTAAGDSIQTDTYSESYFGNSIRGDYYEIYVFGDAAGGNITLNLKIQEPENIYPSDYVDPSNFLPKLRCDEIIKFITYYFGCDIYFQQASKTLQVNIIEKIIDTEDWSEFYDSHTAIYAIEQAKNNYVKFLPPDETQIKKYNEIRKVGYGEGVIETDNELVEDYSLSEFPFAPSSFGQDLNGVWLANVPLVNLVDEGAAINFSAIANAGGGLAQFTSTIDLEVWEVIRIVNNHGNNMGYFTVVSITTGPSTFTCYFPFTSNYAGTFYRQKINFNNIKPRILSFKNNTNFSDFASTTGGLRTWNSQYNLVIVSGSTPTPVNYSTHGYAVFAKSKTGEQIDKWKNNCAIDNPDISDFTDPTVSQLYYGNITRMIKRPMFEIRLILPESVFAQFDFSKFVFIKTEKLTGYFKIDSIEEYRDGNTIAKVKAYMI